MNDSKKKFRPFNPYSWSNESLCAFCVKEQWRAALVKDAKRVNGYGARDRGVSIAVLPRLIVK